MNKPLEEFKMNYRKIELDTSNNDEKLEELLSQIAKWHNLTPM